LCSLAVNPHLETARCPTRPLSLHRTSLGCNCSALPLEGLSASSLTGPIVIRGNLNHTLYAIRSHLSISDSHAFPDYTSPQPATLLLFRLPHILSYLAKFMSKTLSSLSPLSTTSPASWDLLPSSAAIFPKVDPVRLENNEELLYLVSTYKDCV